MEPSIFTQIIRGEIPSHTIYEDDRVVAFLDIFPVSKGHALVVPKNQEANVLESSMEDVTACMEVIRALAPRIVGVVGADGFNVHTNVGAAAGQTVFHTHFHIIPRFDGDDVMVLKQLEEKPNFEALAEKIKQAL